MNDIADYCVVGSGPAAVACAHALLSSGARVRMLDAGIRLEPERRPLLDRLAQTPIEQWARADLDEFRADVNPDVGGVPLKLVYGSDFAYRLAGETLGVSYQNAGLRPSFAAGGLTNVWGAAMMPYADSDMQAWPFSRNALSAHYTAVLDLIGLAGGEDDLAELFPLFTQNLTHLELSGQSRQLLGSMTQHRATLQRAGISFGRSRLAVRGKGKPSNDGCQYCRLCLSGCPWDLIYTAAHTVAQLQKNARFTYEPNVVVTSVHEVNEGVEIRGRRLGSGEPLSWQTDRVFLAAGVIPTTQIMLRSLDAYDTTVYLKDSQYFLVPMLARRTRGAGTERAFGLAQLFLELFDPTGGERSAHVQIYSNSDIISAAVAKAFGPFRTPLGALVRSLQERAIVAQGFLHSDYSSRIGVRLRRSQSGAPEELQLTGETNGGAANAVRAVVRKLIRHSREIGAVPLRPMLTIAEPGRSFHSGGSFPMREKPVGLETDLLGRVPGWRRIHAADATVFPSIPATTITLSAMANAHRIGQAASLLDRNA